MTWYKHNGVILKKDDKIAVDLSCCCGCPCGSNMEEFGGPPPWLPFELTGTVTNKTGSAVCLPDVIPLFGGFGWQSDLLQLENFPCITSPPDFNFFFLCDSGQNPKVYIAYYRCGDGNQVRIVYFTRISQKCNPLRVVFVTGVIDSDHSCIARTDIDTGVPLSEHSFTFTVTE